MDGRNRPAPINNYVAHVATSTGISLHREISEDLHTCLRPPLYINNTNLAIMDEDFIPLEAPSTSTSTPKGGKGSTASESKNQNSTVFVSSLPYNATSTDLVTHFSFIGPIRHGFVATDRETGKSKGVGYVTYAMKEDAERALEELNGSAFGAKGRKIRVSMADRKVSRCVDGHLEPGRDKRKC